MKAEFDKEIDSLLRRESARRGRAAATAAPDAAHLDADEQSAYAENALPAAARAYYAAHLADCDDCRRSVTRLALAAGMPAQLEPREAETGQTISPNINWRERLAALFAPRALRYVAPALALLLVGAVSLIVLTRKPAREAGSIAQHNTSETQRAARPAQMETQTEGHHAPQNADAATAATATPAGDGATPAPDQNTPQAREEIAANSPRAEVAQPVVIAPLEDAAPPPPAPASGGGVGARVVTALPTPVPTPAAVASDAVMSTSAQEAKTKSSDVSELRKLEQRPGVFDNRQYENRQREQVSGPRRNNNNEQARSARAANADAAQERADKADGNIAATTAPPAAAARRSAGREPERGKDENRVEGDSESAGGRPMKSAETRTVAGRKFRRQDNAWVDTAFNAGQSYTVVRRNSEQFRALVADEPQLRRIAGALGGEVTVVWKGRAYRIR